MIDNTGSDDELLTQWLTFTLGKETYCIEILHVQEILRESEISPVPGAPPHVYGIINLRQAVITVHNTGLILGLSGLDNARCSNTILVEWNGNIQGFVVDSVTEIIQIKNSGISPQTFGENTKKYILGTYQQHGKLYVLLSFSELMNIDNEVLD